RRTYRRRPKFSYPSNRHPMTLFEFLSAAAWAGIVSSNFGCIALRLSRRAVATVVVLLRHDEFSAALFSLDLFCLLFFLDRLKQEEEPQRVFLDAAHQFFKQDVGLLFVLN